MNYINNEKEEAPSIPLNNEQTLDKVPEEQKTLNSYKIISIAIIVILLGVLGCFYYNNLNKDSLTTEITGDEIENNEGISNENIKIPERDSLPITISITEGEQVKLWDGKEIELLNLDFTTGAHQQGTIVLNITSTTGIDRSTKALIESLQYDIQGIKIDIIDITSTSTTLVLDKGVSPEDIMVNSPGEFTLVPGQSVHTSQDITYVLDNSNFSLQYVDITVWEDNKFIDAFNLKKGSSHTKSGLHLTVVDILPNEALFTLDETTDWQTYKNEEYRFEIKYPSNLNPVKEHINTVCFFQQDECIMRIIVNENIPFMKERYENEKIMILQRGETFKESTINVGGKNGKLLNINNSSTEIILYLDTEDFLYDLVIYKNQNNLFDEIIKSFRFIN